MITLSEVAQARINIIEIETDDVNASLRDLAAHSTGLNRMKIRQPNLEDLFLDLTGHSLRT